MSHSANRGDILRHASDLVAPDAIQIAIQRLPPGPFECCQALLEAIERLD